MKLGDVKDAAILAAVLGGGYLAYKTFGKARDGLTTVGEKIGSGLYEFFNPDPLRDQLFLAVRFPDGSARSVSADLVDQNGFFTFTDGKRYRILIDKRVTSGINKTAVPA